ncbi:MAG: hypothetical protein D3910_00490 [Candidatus Electrothrix sp. ATG2]|nr:hypothetical protein [Candidatus Electrothrix sp. ATG2]
MAEIKISARSEETVQQDGARKQPYIKPSMKSISLFADEVLSGCSKYTTDPVELNGCGGGAFSS